MSHPFDVFVVSHTHWDREWYHPVGRFRQRLVTLIDELLDDEPAQGESFLLDGQAVVLEDYLAVRPERAGELAARLQGGALEAGPWYVLADELIPGGEALVRNLLAGRRVLRTLRAEAPPVLYSPDAFGHPGSMPTLAAGFGSGVVVLWRGYGGGRWPDGDVARWRAPDGTRVVLYHLPPDGYEFGSNLPSDDAEARARWTRMREVLAPRARLGVLLVQNGADHHARQSKLRESLAALERAATPARVVRGRLRDFAAEVERRAAAATLPEVTGELRDSYGYTWTLQGTFSTRAYQKRRNARVERLLVREAEPWAAFAARARATSSRHLIRAAWKSLLLCHPHDTLCGCSIDDVARAMDVRLDDAEAQAQGVCDDALLALLGHDAEAARVSPARWRPLLVVRNPAARPRGGVAEVNAVTFLQDVQVGPRSGRRAARATKRRGAPVALGDGAPIQILERRAANERTESPRHYPDNDLVEVARAVAWVPPVAGYGTLGIPLASADGGSADGGSEMTRRMIKHPVAVEKNRLDNGLIRLAIDSRGVVSLDARDGAAAVESLVGFEDVGDAGDLYTHSPVGKPLASAWFAGARTLHRGPLRGELEVRWRLRVPTSRLSEVESQGASPRGRRSGRHVEIPLTVNVSLDADAPFVRLEVRGTNAACDHRLRVVLGTGVQTPRVFADAMFGPVHRAALNVPPEDRALETPPPTAPLHRYVSLFGDAGGATVYSDGLAEYEARDDGSVAVTLVRAVGELSRDALPERPGHAGWPVPTPLAQCLGPFSARFAVFPHGPRTTEMITAIEQVADDVLLPLRGTTLRSALSAPPPTAGVELDGVGLAFSAAKESEDGRWLVLRCVNLLDEPVRGRWRLGGAVQEAMIGRLDETPLQPLPVDDGDVVPFAASARAVMTVLVR